MQVINKSSNSLDAVLTSGFGLLADLLCPRGLSAASPRRFADFGQRSRYKNQE